MDFLKNDPRLHFYLSLGMFTETWAKADHALDMCIAVIFHRYGGSTLCRKLPKPLEKRIDFVRDCRAKLPQLASFPQGIEIADRFAQFSERRHTLIHGIAANEIGADAIVQKIRLRTEALMHHEERTSTSPREIMEFTEEITNLANDTLLLCNALVAPLKVQQA